jgi:UDP-N-acetylmuramoyl-tripeptide--D-alanyl-D-alanine ligase
MRMTRQAVGALTVVNDAYNANPDAVLASLRAFAELAADATRRVSVLGDMLELGDGAAAMHAEVGRAAAASGASLAVFVGELSASGAEAARAAGGCEVLHVQALDDAGVAAIAAALRPGDAVLLKGSRGSRMERLLQALKDRAEGAVAGAR